MFGKIKTNKRKIIQLTPDYTEYFWIPWINVDMNPAQDPYDNPLDEEYQSIKEFRLIDNERPIGLF